MKSHVLSLLAVTLAVVALCPRASAQTEYIREDSRGLFLGTSTNTKVSLYGVTPVFQASGTSDLLTSLKSLGVIKSGASNTPLNLGSGALQAGTLTLSGTSYGGSIQTATVVSPTLTGTVTLSGITLTGTETGGVHVTPTVVSPSYSGTATGALAMSGTLTILTGTAGSPPQGSLGVSGTSLYFYNGTVWNKLTP